MTRAVRIPALFKRLSVPLCSLWALWDISASVAATVTISELTDFNFGEVPANVKRLRAREDFCVDLEPRGVFNLQGLGDDSDGGFVLINGAGDKIRYEVQVRNRTLAPGELMTGLKGKPRKNNGRCGSTHRMDIEINKQDLESAPGGAYRGQLRLIVIPE
jgi:hypothetical protein